MEQLSPCSFSYITWGVRILGIELYFWPNRPRGRKLDNKFRFPVTVSLQYSNKSPLALKCQLRIILECISLLGNMSPKYVCFPSPETINEDLPYIPAANYRYFQRSNCFLPAIETGRCFFRAQTKKNSNSAPKRKGTDSLCPVKDKIIL